ncbi:MAG: zinc protease, partial [Bacteroidia bacterium]
MRKTSILFTLCFFLLSIVGLRAQDNQVPLDPGVRTGVLSNGLTYYILPNKKPEQKVELRLAVNAGSILENDNQQGLAHFLEHMAFNGTENFKKNELVDYLQSAGVKFGAHLNAYTSFDETVYMLALPTDNAEVLEKGFQILEDWAHNLLLDSAEIEKERGVVLEEYRLGLGASKRMLAKYLPKTLYQSQYVDRLPIGKKEILENFDRATILEFYQKWYRPDLMAVIVVGDINVDEIEAKIKSHFGGIKNPPNAAPRNIINVPDHEETFAAFATDAEATYGSVQFVQKQPGTFTKKGTEEEALESLKWSLMFFVLNQRYQELAQKPGSPFSYAYGYKGGMWARNKEAVQGFSVVAGGKYKEALEVMMLEMERLKRYGITENELKRAHMDYASYYEKQLKEKDKTESRSHAGNLVAYFLENESFESEEWALNFYNTHKDRIAIAELNTMFASVFYNENRVVVMTGPDSDKDKMPSEAEVLQILENIQVMEIEAYEENILPDQLFSLQPTSGSVVSTSKPSKVGSTTLTLSNGMKIIYKTTTLKNDEILFNARSKGGTYLYDDKMYKTISNGLGVLSNCGVGQFSESDLSKMLAGKNVNVSPYVGSSTEGMSGNCAPKDMETMMQLIHMFFVQPRKEQEAFDAYVNRQRAFYDNMAADPGQFFNISWNSFMYNNHPRMFTIPTDADWNNLSYDLINEIYKERFANAADFTFVFVGNIEVEAFKTMAEKYLASLPGNK